MSSSTPAVCDREEHQQQNSRETTDLQEAEPVPMWTTLRPVPAGGCTDSKCMVVSSGMDEARRRSSAEVGDLVR